MRSWPTYCNNADDHRRSSRCCSHHYSIFPHLQSQIVKVAKVRILAVFSTSAVTTIVSLTHAYYIISGGGLREVMAGIVECSMSLIVVNLSVVVAFIFRLSSDDDLPSTPTPIVTFGGQRRTRRMTVAVESTTILLQDFPESRHHTMKRSDDNDVTLHNRERMVLEHKEVNPSSIPTFVGKGLSKSCCIDQSHSFSF